VFYDVDWLLERLAPHYGCLKVAPEAHQFQTALVLERV